MSMVRRMPLAFLGAARAGQHAGAQEVVRDSMLGSERAREDLRGGDADIGAVHAQRRAETEAGDVLVGQIRVGARRAADISYLSSS